MLVNLTSVLLYTEPPVTGDEEECLRSPYYRNTIFIMFIAVIILSSIENILLWFAFLTTKRLRTIAVAYFISLSASDFITVATLGWMEAVYVFEYPVWIFGEIGSFAINAFWCFSLVTPFTHIIFITIDRYRAVTSSTVYSQTKSWKSELLKIAAIWIYSIAIVLLFTFHFSPANDQYYEWNVLPEWYYPFVAIHIILPLIICTVLYTKMIHHVKIHKATIRRYIGNPTLREFKVARSVGIIITFLYLVWIPVIALELVYATQSHTCLIGQLGTISVWLTCTSGVINPIILLSKNSTYRDAICCIKRRHFSTVTQFLAQSATWFNINTTLAVPTETNKETSAVVNRLSTSSEISVIMDSRSSEIPLPTIEEDH